ncbi:hypothetical protein [Streptomyces macrosporus]|uniref:Uncharacterized protein n=1 Tax=Streptomyces macrosporus TaxID=44032 RepID=A0ABN3KFM8_9ACTN
MNGNGTVYLTYSSSNGHNCAVTVNNTGEQRWIGGKLKTSSSSSWEDEGWYTFHAGPAHVYARATCVDGGGHVRYGKESGDTYITWKDHRG